MGSEQLDGVRSLASDEVRLGLGLGVPELAKWLAASGLALSPGHWFGREGTGFARMSIAVESAVIDEAIQRLNRGLPK